MKRIVRISAGILALVVGAFVLIAFLLPRQVRVERHAMVSRPPCTMFAVLDGFSRFQDWSPWADLDPATVYTHEGPSHGVGATMGWKSEHPDVGNGSQRVTGVKACDRIDLTLTFDGTDADAGYVLRGVEGGTDITWWMVSDMGNNPVARFVGTRLDGWVGPDFERGLNKLQQIALKLPTADFGDLKITKVDVEATTLAAVLTTSAKDPMAVGASLGTTYAIINQTLTLVGLSAAGAPRASYRDDGPGYAITATLPVVGNATASLPPDGPVRMRQSYSGPALRAIHVGPYDGLADSWKKLEAYAEVMEIKVSNEVAWEEYLSDPATTEQTDLQTALVLPVN